MLLNSEVPPIIILQADEGPFPPRLKLIQDWAQATGKELKIKMGILNAYYLPGIDKNVLYPSITPVNSFRIVFNLYFNINFELLPDESYVYSVYADERGPYKFTNVTNKLRGNSGTQ